MALSLEEMRRRLREEKDKQEKGSGGYDNASYPFWNIPYNESNDPSKSAITRFVADGDKDNDFFWKVRAMVRLPFAGIKNLTDKEVHVQVPCMFTWGETCPIQTAIKDWWATDKARALKYWRKNTYLYQGFVRHSPFKEESPPENPIRRFILNEGLHNQVKAIILDPGIKYIPTDMEHGRDFIINKTKKGEYADYSTSRWSFNESELTDQEKEAIQKYGLFNLSQFLPIKPDEKRLQIIMDMFEASVDFQPYDPDRWGEFYKPTGFDDKKDQDTSKKSGSSASSKPNSKSDTSTMTSVRNKNDDSSVDVPWDRKEIPEPVKVVSETIVEKKRPTAEEILAQLKAKTKKS